MRLGWDDSSKNAAEIARRVADCGAHFVTVHGRTRNQFYKGAADWRAIAAVRAAISIPLVANGDCASLADAREMLAQSGADAVMIGRAAIGRPWLVGEIGAGLSGAEDWRAPGPAEKQRAALSHFDHLIAAFGPDKGVRHARKHLAAYADFAAADGCGLGPQQRAALTRTQDAAEARDLLAACWIEQRDAA
jgi:tRNA-dihydrouridine synthase